MTTNAPNMPTATAEEADQSGEAEVPKRRGVPGAIGIMACAGAAVGLLLGLLKSDISTDVPDLNELFPWWVAVILFAGAATTGLVSVLASFTDDAQQVAAFQLIMGIAKPMTGAVTAGLAYGLALGWALATATATATGSAPSLLPIVILLVVLGVPVALILLVVAARRWETAFQYLHDRFNPGFGDSLPPQK